MPNERVITSPRGKFTSMYALAFYISILWSLLSLKGAFQNKEKRFGVNLWIYFFLKMILKQFFKGKVVVPSVCMYLFLQAKNIHSM